MKEATKVVVDGVQVPIRNLERYRKSFETSSTAKVLAQEQEEAAKEA